jgi:mono/diheme cytochrome c family protein
VRCRRAPLPQPPLPRQHQTKPSHEALLNLPPKYDAPCYQGFGKWTDKVAIITADDSGTCCAAVLFARERLRRRDRLSGRERGADIFFSSYIFSFIFSTRRFAATDLKKRAKIEDEGALSSRYCNFVHCGYVRSDFRNFARQYCSPPLSHAWTSVVLPHADFGNTGAKGTFQIIWEVPLLKPIAAFLFLVASLAPGAAQDVARGRYLTVLGDCAGCHDSPDHKHLAGGRALSAAFGTVYSSNITPHSQTGIGKWSADEFWRALHDGIRKDGAPLYPAFPYPYFRRFSRADTDAIFAYLLAQKPVSNVRPPNALHFPFNIRSSLWFWNRLYRDEARAGIHAGKPLQWKRGEFIVNGPGHCAACHTPKNALFGDRNSLALTGETVDNWFAANLTASPRDGLAQWTAQDIEIYLKTGQDRFATAIGPMQDVVLQSTSLMTDSDRAAVAAYLKGLPANGHRTPNTPSADMMANGEAVYVQHCAICHEGEAGIPSLHANTLVQARTPTTVLRVVLGGSQSVALTGSRPSYSMPSLATLDDASIAAVVTYIRNAWGNRADPVAPADVARLRKATDGH